MAVAACADESRIVRRSAPRPTSPRQIKPSAGAPMIPNNGVPSVTKARLTVNSLRPATYSLVPSKGSIRKKLPRNGRPARQSRSSETAGIDGISRARPSPMMRSAARSASVTGDPSSLPSTFMTRRSMAMIAAPAWTTRSVRGAISAAAASQSITGADKSASLLGVPRMQSVVTYTFLSTTGMSFHNRP